MAFNASKFDALVHYICSVCTAAKLGAVKLNKVLYYADMMTYALHGASITGATYIKRQNGPVPKQIDGSLQRLERAKKIVVRDVPFFDFMKRDFLSLVEADVSKFSGEEIRVVDEFIRFVCDEHTAKEISNISHTAIWEAAQIGEELPYATFFASYSGEVDESDLKWARGEIKKVRQAA